MLSFPLPVLVCCCNRRVSVHCPVIPQTWGCPSKPPDPGFLLSPHKRPSKTVTTERVRTRLSLILVQAEGDLSSFILMLFSFSFFFHCGSSTSVPTVSCCCPPLPQAIPTLLSTSMGHSYLVFCLVPPLLSSLTLPATAPASLSLFLVSMLPLALFMLKYTRHQFYHENHLPGPLSVGKQCILLIPQHCPYHPGPLLLCCHHLSCDHCLGTKPLVPAM